LFDEAGAIAAHPLDCGTNAADTERLSMKMSSRRGHRGGLVRAEFAAVAEQGPEHVDEAAGER
jgi:hypothetical protein